MSVLPAGADVPDFTLRREDGEPFEREDLAGTTTVLVFYPSAFSSVCTDQFQIYEEVLDDLAALGATLYGVSIDQTDSQVAFRESVRSSIPMLSDAHPQAATAKAFGVFFEPTGVANRALVIVGPDLKVQWSWEGEHPGTLPGVNLIFDGLAVNAR
ncbi:MAG TPA: redoxin domain-containing protein [Solirubrobacteraceae bacterium]|nr:redoxin domain-containing protein [Solirubrobacteraceae bacterium]